MQNLYAVYQRYMDSTFHKAKVGRRLRTTIEALGLTQVEAARALDVSPSKLGNWLRGDNYPSAWFVTRFCDRYGVTTDWVHRGIVSVVAFGIAETLSKSEQIGQRETATE